MSWDFLFLFLSFTVQRIGAWKNWLDMKHNESYEHTNGVERKISPKENLLWTSWWNFSLSSYHCWNGKILLKSPKFARELNIFSQKHWRIYYYSLYPIHPDAFSSVMTQYTWKFLRVLNFCQLLTSKVIPFLTQQKKINRPWPRVGNFLFSRKINSCRVKIHAGVSAWIGLSNVYYYYFVLWKQQKSDLLNRFACCLIYLRWTKEWKSWFE